MGEWLEYAKIVVGVVAYLVIAPGLGVLVKGYRPGHVALFVIMIVATAFHTDQITLTAFSVNHTGHTRGFEVSLMVFAAIALLFATYLGRSSDVKFLPPGIMFYGGFCLAGAFTLVLTLPLPWPDMLVSLESNGSWIRARNIWEAINKFFQLGLVFLATHAFIRNKSDMLWFARSLAIALIIAGSYAVIDRYGYGVHRVRATFDHSNSFGIWAYMGAIPCLVLAYHRSVPVITSWLLFVGYGFGAVSVVFTLARASLMIVAVLSVVAFVWGMYRHRCRKTYLLGACWVGMATIGVMYSMDSVAERVMNMRAAASMNEAVETEDLRVVLAKQASVMLGDSVFGVGWNNYQIACSLPVVRYVQILRDHEAADGDNHSDETFFSAPVVESLYWYLLAETGYVGFTFFLLFMLATLWLALKHGFRYRKTWVGDFLLAFVLVLSALYMHSFLEKVLLQTKNAVLWLAMLAIASKLETIRRQKVKDANLDMELSEPQESPVPV